MKVALKDYDGRRKRKLPKRSLGSKGCHSLYSFALDLHQSKSHPPHIDCKKWLLRVVEVVALRCHLA